jgi:hypothetical protein
VLGVTLLRGGELQEDVATVVVGVVRQAAEQRAARDFVGVHLLEPLASLRVVHFRLRHAATVPSAIRWRVMRAAVLQ